MDFFSENEEDNVSIYANKQENKITKEEKGWIDIEITDPKLEKAVFILSLLNREETELIF